MVSARCVERSGQLRQEAEGRQSTNRNLPDPGSARGGRLRRELSPGDSSMERQRTLQVGIGGDNADTAADVRGQACDCTVSAPTVELSQGIALLASMGIHFTALSVGSLAGEQISQSLDVLPGDFWWHRLT